MTACTIKTLAAAIGARAEGETGMEIDRPCHPADAKSARDLALAMDASLHDRLRNSPARAAVLLGDTDWKALGLEAVIYVEHARSALVSITGLFARPPELAPGVHPSAVVGPDVELGEGVAIGPFVEIGAGVRIGANSCVLGGASLGREAEIGPDCLLYSGVRIGERVRIGARAILHANAVLGSDGFSFPLADRERVERVLAGGDPVSVGGDGGYVRIHSLGAVRVGDDVEIGAGTAIDRGTVADTEIGDGTKIDNLVHIAHNVRIGRNCLICGQVGIAGSARIGDRVILGGQVGVGDHVEIGADCMIGGKSLVGRKVRPGSILVGWASLSRDEFRAVFQAVRRLARKSRGS